MALRSCQLGPNSPKFPIAQQFANGIGVVAEDVSGLGDRDKFGDVVHENLPICKLPLMGAAAGRAALKTGAEAVFVGMIPETGFGIALKVVDGGTRGAECAIAALMVRLGILDPNNPAVLKRMNAVQKNWRGIETGIIRPAAHLLS